MKWLLFFSFSIYPLGAYYSGSPIEPGLIEEGFFSSTDTLASLSVSYLRDGIFNQRFRDNPNGTIGEFRFNSNQGVFCLNFLNRIDLLGFLGKGSVESTLSTGMISEVAFKSRPSLVWALGARVLPLEFDDWCFGVEGKYFQAKGAISQIEKNGVRTFQREMHANFIYDGWQVGASLGVQTKFLSPYIGVKVGKTYYLLDQFPLYTLSKGRGLAVMAKNRVGLILGMSLSNGEVFAMTIESRLIDEDALSLMMTTKF